MKTNLSSSKPSQLETDCLVVVTLDQSEKDKPSAIVESSDAVVRDASKDVISSGEVSAKLFESTLLHNPTGLKAKRLLLIGGGKAKTFSAAELRKLAGAAVRTLKGKNIRSFFGFGAGRLRQPGRAQRPDAHASEGGVSRGGVGPEARGGGAGKQR